MPSVTNGTEDGAEVFVLGAGFSRAVAELMPLTDELGNEALERDPQHLGRAAAKSKFRGGQFEAWLSRRADPQPYLTSVQAMESRADFARTTALIAEILDERVKEALKLSLPVWLGELLSIWHLRQSHVLTFNYDPLVECAFETLQLSDWRSSTRFQWGSLLSYSPEGKAGTSFGEVDGTSGPHPSFRLWKLHGSLNWLWVPGDSSGATVRRIRLPGLFGAPAPITSEEAHWAAPGRERFIVPPAALKSGYYANPITREIWQRGYEALRGASRVSLMGYSVPQSDLSTSGMLAEALARGTVRELNVVDREPGGGEIPGRLRQLGDFGVTILAEHSGDNAIPRYVDELVSCASKEAVDKIRKSDIQANACPYIDWGEAGTYPDTVGRAAAITSVRWDESRQAIVLCAENLDRIETATRSRNGEHTASDVPVSLDGMNEWLGRADRLFVTVPGIPRDVSIIDVVETKLRVGHGTGTWLHLVPAGAPA